MLDAVNDESGIWFVPVRKLSLHPLVSAPEAVLQINKETLLSISVLRVSVGAVKFKKRNDPHYEKTGYLHMRKQRRSAFVFATRMIQSLYFLYTNFRASSHLL